MHYTTRAEALFPGLLRLSRITTISNSYTTSAGLLLNKLGDQSGPAGLMAGANAGPVVPMEIFVEEDMIAPVGVALEAVRGTEDGPPPAVIAQKDAYEAA